jgi:hypothetical protein
MYATEKKEIKSIGLQVDFFEKKAPHREAELHAIDIKLLI